jgi:hypothetical protein
METLARTATEFYQRVASRRGLCSLGGPRRFSGPEFPSDVRVRVIGFGLLFVANGLDDPIRTWVVVEPKSRRSRCLGTPGSWGHPELVAGSGKWQSVRRLSGLDGWLQRPSLERTFTGRLGPIYGLSIIAY